jgi:hypothetical protein
VVVATAPTRLLALPAASATDAFGTNAIYPSAASGREWHARWSSNPRVLRAGQVDPYDPEFFLEGEEQTLEIHGDGVAKSYGEQIRLYIGDRTRAKTWLNVELTVYGKRTSERSGAGADTGFEFQARSGDGHTSATALGPSGLPLQCDGHAYGFSFRNDGRALVEKEIRHPTYTAQAGTNVWGGGTFPKNRWVGMKLIVYNVDGGAHVKQELWRDLTDGVDGGTWVKVFEHTDAGGWAIERAVAAACGVPPDHLITTPQPLVIVRNDHVSEQWYKKITIREIAPGGSGR